MRHVLLFVAVGCSSSLPPVNDPMAAEDSVSQLEAVANAMAASDGTSALTAMLATLTDCTTITGYPTGTTPPSYAVVTATCSPASCTLAATATASMAGPDYSLMGTLTADGDAIAMSLTVGGGGQSPVDRKIWRVSIYGSITVNATQLDGSVMVIQRTSIAGVVDSDAELDYAIAYHAVRLDAQGCPIGGSLTATTTGIDPASNTRAMIDIEQGGSFGQCGVVH